MIKKEVNKMKKILFILGMIIPTSSAYAISNVMDSRWNSVSDDFLQACEILESKDKSMKDCCFFGAWDVFSDLPDKKALIIKEKGSAYFFKKYKKEFKRSLDNCLKMKEESAQQMEDDMEYYEALMLK